MTLSNLKPLSAAEQRLLDDCTSATRTVIGGGELPATETLDNVIRADVIRLLMLDRAGDARLHEKGLRLRGAVITGSLDLQSAQTGYDLTLTNCVLTQPINVVNTRMQGLHLSGCRLAGLSGDNAEFDGAVYIRAGCVVNGEISLSGAVVRGDFQIVDAVLASETQDAIFAPSLMVEDSLYLGNYPYTSTVTELHCQGGVFLASLSVGADLFITNCAVSPNDDIAAGVFANSEEHGIGNVISLARAKIGGLLHFKANQISSGIVNLAGAEVKRLHDEPMGPGASYRLRLDGFTYSDFSRHTDTSVKARLAWLNRRPDDTGFVAQPYEQLARVLFHMGHRNDARTVLMQKERLLRTENRTLIRKSSGTGLRWLGASMADFIMRWAVGYGYRPARAMIAAVVLIIGLGLFFDQVWKAGDMTPNAAPILVSRNWVDATEIHPENPAAFWSSKGQGGQDWETFNGYAYAADLVIPIVNLGQESAWAPSTSRSPLGRIGWWLRWFAKALGWIITALGAAAVTGAVRQD